MKKLKTSLILANLLFSCSSFNLFAEEIIKEDILKEETTQEAKSPKQYSDNLDYLFENSKFPVDDYIYKAGFLKPKNEIISLEQNDTKPLSPLTLPQENSDEEALKKMQDLIKQNEELSNKLKNEQKTIKQEIIVDRQSAYERKIKRLLKDELLSSRNNEIRSFSDNSKYGVDSFSNQKSIDISTNEHKLYRMIRAGRLIPAILTTAISSDLSGVVTAQIEQDIYASMGKAVLIPRGSKAIGFYTNDNQLGQNRLEIKWREIITPQGVNIMLTNAIVADNMGINGAVGSLNNKYWERYGIAYSISTLSNALLLGIASQIDNNGNTYTQELYSSARSDVSSVVNDIIQQQSKIKPTIEIKSGSRIFLVPTNHMWFAKPKNNEVLTKYFKED